MRSKKEREKKAKNSFEELPRGGSRPGAKGKVK
jgi:hypothetical protein